MNNLFDKTILLLVCSILYISTEHETYMVTTILCSVILGTISFYIKKIKINILLQICFLLLCIMNHQFLYFSPVILYDMIFSKKHLDIKLEVFAFISFSFFIGMMLYKQLPLELLSFLFISCIFKYRTKQAEELKIHNNRLRDENYEKNSKLEDEKNSLINQQNSEINVAILNERNRIAREIHDEVGHVLSRAILQVGALKMTFKETEVTEQLEDVSKSLTTGMESIRKSVHDLHEESINLRSEVIKLVKNFTFCPIELEYEIDRNLTVQMKYAIISIIKESLANIIKHSNGNHVKIYLREHPALIQLIIHDNGTRFREKYTGHGMGLENIKMRVEVLNGNINITKDHGFKIFISMPV